MINHALIITRNYPPQVGGLENYSYELIRQFEQYTSCKKITLAKKKIHLLWFYPYCLFKAILLVKSRSIPFVHLCDGVLSPIGWVLKCVTNTRVSVTIHGLDITYHNFFYQKIVPWFIRKLDRVICPSRSTSSECIKRGIGPGKIEVIPNGVRYESLQIKRDKTNLRNDLEKIVGISLERKKVLVTVGRLIKRKGVAWFVDNVMTRLNNHYVYLVVGEGPEKEKIEQLQKSLGLENRLFALGAVTDTVRNLIYHASDLFIMPNISIDDDIEGFGIVAVEAGAVGLPVVGSDVQGIRDAVIEGETGYLVPERDTEGFVNAIMYMDLKKEAVQSSVQERYDWHKVFLKYSQTLASSSIK